jgi:hypothetical protein
VALGAQPGTVHLHLFEGLVHGHASISTLGRDDYTEVEAEMRTLDDLLGAEPQRPALIKIDVEGAERGVLGGATATIASDDPPVWMIEVNVETSAAFGYRPAELLADLRAGSPHDVYRVTPDGLVADVAPDTAPHGTTWVCVPPGRRDRVSSLVSGARPR